MTELKEHSEIAWNIAREYSYVLASDTRTLAGSIDDALEAEREACAKIAETQDAGAGEIVNVIAAQIRAR